MEEEELEPSIQDPETEIDPRSRFKEYLQTQIARKNLMPEYQERSDMAREGLHRAKDDANLGALLMNSAARFGMAGGKQIQGGLQPFAQQQSQNLDRYMADQDARRARAEQRELDTGKLYEYLARQQGAEEAEKLARYKAETDRKKLDKEAKSTKGNWKEVVGPDGSVNYYDPDTQELRKSGLKQRIPVEKPVESPATKYGMEFSKEWEQSPVTKTTRESQAALKKVVDAPDTAPGHMSLIYGFMKMQDPGSTVREGEYASAENARGIPDTIRNLYNKAKDGTKLTPDQVMQFKDAAQGLYKAQLMNQKQFDERLIQRANKVNVPKEDLFITDFEKATPQPGMAPIGGPGVANAAPGPQKVMVSNGKETLLIDPSDEADAAKDGFRRVP